MKTVHKSDTIIWDQIIQMLKFFNSLKRGGRMGSVVCITNCAYCSFGGQRNLRLSDVSKKGIPCVRQTLQMLVKKE
jgi:hypothetical protein